MQVHVNTQQKTSPCKEGVSACTELAATAVYIHHRVYRLANISSWFSAWSKETWAYAVKYCTEQKISVAGRPDTGPDAMVSNCHSAQAAAIVQVLTNLAEMAVIQYSLFSSIGHV